MKIWQTLRQTYACPEIKYRNSINGKTWLVQTMQGKLLILFCSLYVYCPLLYVSSSRSFSSATLSLTVAHENCDSPALRLSSWQFGDSLSCSLCAPFFFRRLHMKSFFLSYSPFFYCEFDYTFQCDTIQVECNNNGYDTFAFYVSK